MDDYDNDDDDTDDYDDDEEKDDDKDFNNNVGIDCVVKKTSILFSQFIC